MLARGGAQGRNRYTAGARRQSARVVRQLLTEGLVLALLAGASASRRVLPAVRRVPCRRRRDTLGFFPFSVTPDALVFLYATLLAAASWVVFGLAPALQ